jgi:HTH-type transcriptional regulator, cell division transcriptional repressor
MQISGQSSTPKSRGQRLRFLRKMSGLTLHKLAKKYDMGMSTIKYWECAINQGLSAKGAKKIVNAMHQEGIQCSFMWLMHGVGLAPQIIDVRYNNPEFSRKELSLPEEISIAHEIALFCEKIIDAVTLAVYDDGMEPLFSVGDNVGGKRLFGENIVNAIGKNCIVETEENQILCRRISQGTNSGLFNLYCTNPHTAISPPNLYDVKLLSVAPVTRLWKRN